MFAIDQFAAGMQEHIRTAPPLAYLISYLMGVAVSFSPCVYPVIPITFAYIGGHSVGDRKKALLLSLSYALGLAVVYTALGLFAAMTGRLFGQISTHPLALFGAANLFLLLGLAMLDALPMPQWNLIKQGGAQKRGGFIGAFLVGAGSGLVVGPCTAPVLGAILIYVAKNGNVIYGGTLLFAFAIGLSTLLVIVGAFAGALANLPKSGPWLVIVKKIFGWILIIVAEYMFIQLGGRLI